MNMTGCTRTVNVQQLSRFWKHRTLFRIIHLDIILSFGFRKDCASVYTSQINEWSVTVRIYFTILEIQAHGKCSDPCFKISTVWLFSNSVKVFFSQYVFLTSYHLSSVWLWSSMGCDPSQYAISIMLHKS